MERIMKYLLTVAIFVLSGCASNSGIVPMGSDTYMVSRQAATGFTGMGTLKAEAMREAYQQCQKSGKSVKVIETIDAKPPYILGNFPKTEIRFKCVEES
jgi:hypothetical protein